MSDRYIVRIHRGRYYQRRGYSHRLVSRALADRMNLLDATVLAWRVFGEVLAA